jgi:type IV pilus assembly protein PilQ
MRTSHLLFLTAAALTATAPAFAAAQPTEPAPATPPPTAPAAAGDKPATATGNPANASSIPADAAKLADKPAAPEVAIKATDDSAKGAATAAAVAKGAKDAAGHETLSVDFPDEDVRNILRNVADLFELNIIMPETLQGKTTIKLRDVTWRQIFSNVLDPVNYTYVEDGNIIKIVTKESLNDEAVTTEIFLINYAKATDILPTISSLVDTAKGKIVVDARSNSLVITERPTRMSRIRPIIEQLDRATDQVMIESKFVEVTNSDIKNIGVNWSSLSNYQISAGNLQSTLSRNRGQTTSDGTTGNNGTSTNTSNGTTGSTNNSTNATQNNGSNTTSSVTSTNGTPTQTSTTGTNGALTSTSSTGTTGGTTSSVTDTLSNTLSLVNSLTNTGDTSRAATALFSASQFNLVLSALQTLSDVKIVSNPTIVTLNNNEATINIGESDPLPNYTFNPQTGTQEVSGFTYKDIGIILKVKPQVNARGTILLTLSPEVSQKNGTLTFGAAQLPIIATRKANTVVSLKDGFTMGIGGLLSTQTTKSGSKVPVLGSLPGIGRLFRSDTTDKQGTNLIIFITAKTLSADGAPTEQVFESERVRELQMRREELPGHRDGSDPFLPSAPLNSGEKPPAKKSIFPFLNSDEKK